MRTWRREADIKICGRCGTFIQPQEPVCVLTLPGSARERWRCQNCEGFAPPDLPLAQVIQKASIPAMTKIRKVIDQWNPPERSEWTPYRD
jgi:hypothetical protein